MIFFFPSVKGVSDFTVTVLTTRTTYQFYFAGLKRQIEIGAVSKFHASVLGYRSA